MTTGYPVAAEALDLEIFQLVCVFSASQSLARIESTYPCLRWVRATFETSEASRRLIGLAVMLRNSLDARIGTKSKAVVGRLVADVSRPSQTVELSLREACNKIIHAELVDLSLGSNEHEECPPLADTIKLQGTHRQKEWEAQIDVLSFLNAACTKF
ncbi:MAG: hypothetical protein LAO21_17765 [Acidobacteriia bacterium]|nr:hypothetical protein [Terriglobia bacterium]